MLHVEGDAAHSNQLLSTIISNALFFFPPPTPSTASKATKATAEEAKKLIEERYHAAINPQESEVITSTLRVLIKTNNNSLDFVDSLSILSEEDKSLTI